MKIILVRHGETDYNTASIVQGWLSSHLTVIGQKQAQFTGQRLAQKSIDAIYCSDLLRTRETAHEITQFVHIPVTYDSWLRERNFGDFQGKPKGTLQHYVKEHKLDLLSFCPSHGESILDFRKRVVDAFDNLLRHEKSSTILLITHGGVIFQILLHLLQFHESEFEKYNPPNCSLTILDIRNNGHTFHAINSIDH